jgi:hypothetical protein
MTLPNVFALIACKLVNTLMGFPRLVVVAYTVTAYEDTKRKLDAVRQASYEVFECRLHHSRGLEG